MKAQFIIDHSGQKLAIISMEDYQQFLKDQEELKAIKGNQQDDDIPEWHNDIIDQRLKEYEQNPDQVLSLEQIKKHIQQRL